MSLTHWEQRKLAIVHDTALALSDGEWDALRWHLEQAFEEGVRQMSRALQGGNEPVNPYAPQEAR